MGTVRKRIALVALVSCAAACGGTEDVPLEVRDLSMTGTSSVVEITFVMQGPEQVVSTVELDVNPEGAGVEPLAFLSAPVGGRLEGSVLEDVTATPEGTRVSVRWDTIAQGFLGCSDAELRARPSQGASAAARVAIVNNRPPPLFLDDGDRVVQLGQAFDLSFALDHVDDRYDVRVMAAETSSVTFADVGTADPVIERDGSRATVRISGTAPTRPGLLAAEIVAQDTPDGCPIERPQARLTVNISFR